jgi:hypothetical protein
MSSASQPGELRWLETAGFVVASLGLHALVLLLLGLSGTPDPGFRFKLPDLVEFGLLEPGGGGNQSADSPPPAPPPQQPKPASPKPTPRPKRTASDAPSLGPVVDAGPQTDASAGDASVDAGSPDAGPPTDAAVHDAQVGDAARPLVASGLGDNPDAQGPGLGVGLAGHGFGGYAPPGAQIALHVNMERLRDTSLILEIHALLQVIPEWQPLLDGSGLDPFTDLTRIFVATPTLSKDDMVVAARYRGHTEILEQAAQRLGVARQRPISFQTRGALRYAPWHNGGSTPRVIALTGESEFVITRQSDLPRVLAVAAALAQRGGAQPGGEHASGPAALLAMLDGEAVALSVEGARRYVQGDLTAVPGAVRLSVQPFDEFHARIAAIGKYESPERAATALRRIDELRRQWIDHPRASYLGIKAALETAELTRDGEHLTVSMKVTLHQTRYLLAYVTRALRPRD